MSINVENLVRKIRKFGRMEQSASLFYEPAPTSHKEELASIQERLLALVIQIDNILEKEPQTKDPPLT